MAASVGFMLGGAIANALAFSGSSFLFSSLQRDSIAAERKRHDEAIEKTQQAQAAWVRERQERIDTISEQLRQEQHAETTFNSLDRALAVYRDVMGPRADQALLNEKIGPRPTLDDFYKPSEAQREREYAFVAISAVAGGVAGKYLL